MYLKEHIVRVENIKTLQALDQANIDHKVIALFMSCEGIKMQAYEVGAILNSYNALGSKKVQPMSFRWRKNTVRWLRCLWRIV